MIATAVDPIARPMRARRTKGFGNACRTEEAGCSSKTTKRQAEIMKRASSAASIRYSGQCRLRESSMVIVTFDAGGGGRFQIGSYGCHPEQRERTAVVWPYPEADPSSFRSSG